MSLYHEDVDFQINDKFLEFKSSVLNVLTFNVPTVMGRCLLQFTTLRLAIDSKEVMVVELGTCAV